MSLLRRIEQKRQQGGGNVERPGVAINVALHAIALVALATHLRTELHARLDPEILEDPTPAAQSAIRELLETILETTLAEENFALKPHEKHKLFEPLVVEVLGFGLLEALLADETISEIMVNGASTIYAVRKGRLEPAQVSVDSEAHLLKILNRILASVCERVDEYHPIARVRLPDGTHVHAVVRPVAMSGPTITIHKYSRRPLRIVDLMRTGVLTTEIAEFLRACVTARLNIVVIGDGIRPGITTLLNVLAHFIPSDERIVAIEAVGELFLEQEQVISLVPRRPNFQGDGEVTMRSASAVGSKASSVGDRITCYPK